jgi:hypothetical protein
LDWLFVLGKTRHRIGDDLCNTVVVRLDEVETSELGKDVAETNYSVSADGPYRTIEAFSIPLEAEILRARLESDGIPAVVIDGNLVQTDWFLSNAVGGAKVQVPERYIERAREIISVMNSGELSA